MLAIVKLIIIFLLMAGILKFKLPLSAALFFGSVGVFLLFQSELSLIPEIINTGILSFDTITLVIIIFLILTFSGILKETGRLERITRDFETAFGGGSAFFIIFPSVIGLLPMPGGAIFSAPMIEKKGIEEGLSPRRLSAINYWFRHNWEFMWFLYPGIIISSEIFDISVWDMFIHHLPLTPIAMFIGWFFLLRGQVSSRTTIQWRRIPEFLSALSPIIILVVSNVILRVINSAIGINIEENLIMILCLVGSIIYMLAIDKPDWNQFVKATFTKKMFAMVFIVFFIFLFKETLELSGAVNETAREIQYYNLPFILVISILPFMVGLLTGATPGFVSTLVVVKTLLDSFPETSVYSVLLFSYVSGIIGVYLSPVHICLIVTKDYYGATLGGTLKELLLPLLFILLTGLGFYFLYNLFY